MAQAAIQYDVYDAELNLADILRAFSTSEEGLAVAPDRERRYIAAVLSDHPEAERGEIERHLVNEAFAEIERSRQAICQAFVLANFSAFEFGVLRICENYLKASSNKLSLRDLAHQGYEKFLLIAKKLAEAPIHNESHWTAASHYRIVRNQIAHNGGMCVNNDEFNKVDKALVALGNARLVAIPNQEMWSIAVEPRFVIKMNSKMTLLVRSAHETLEGML